MAARMAMAMVATALCLGPAVAQDAAPSSLEITEKLNEAKRFLNDRKLEEAKGCLEEVLTLNPKLFEANMMMAAWYMNQSNVEPAIPWFAKASDSQADHFHAAAEAGNGYRRYKQYDKAIPYLERALLALKTGQGFHPEQQKSYEYFTHASLCECLYELKKYDACQKACETAIAAYPECVNPYYYLGMMAYEQKNDVTTAIERFKQGAEIKVEQPYAGMFHTFGMQGLVGECTQMHNHLALTVPRYGDLKGDKFIDAEKEFSMEKPAKMKEWAFLFINHPPPEAGKIVTHVITLARTAGAGLHTVRFDINGGTTATINMTMKDGKQIKLVETESFANGWRGELVDTYTEVTEDQPVRKNVAFGKYKAFYFSFKGKEKAAVTNVQRQRAEGQSPKEPVVWENHCWVIKGKKCSFWIHAAAQPDFWKKYQKEIQLQIIRTINFPA